MKISKSLVPWNQSNYQYFIQVKLRGYGANMATKKIDKNSADSLSFEKTVNRKPEFVAKAKAPVTKNKLVPTISLEKETFLKAKNNS